MKREYKGKNYENQHISIFIDVERDKKLDPLSMLKLQDKYLLPNETSPQEAFARAAVYYSDNDNMAQRIYNYASNLWFMFATPVLANAGTNRGLPISCYLNYVPDSREGITHHMTENAWLSSVGGGIGGYWGDVRPIGAKISRGGTSTGVIPFMCVADKTILAFNQGSTRRGSYAAYLPVNHPEIEEFLRIRDPNGDSHRRTNRKSFHTAVIIDNEFMEAVERDEMIPLIDPNSGDVMRNVNALALWREILSKRHETGEPYIMFSDNVEEGKCETYKKLGLDVKQSNLCSEITLATGLDQHGKMRTAVCCLSSLNLETFDEWEKDEEFIYDMVRFLDNTLQSFINEAPDEISNARYAAIRERSLGLGAMGFHSWLQKKGVPFESAMAVSWNKKMFKHIQFQALEATAKLAEEKGVAPDCAEAGVKARNANVTAIAPNASSSIICGYTSPGIEPWSANFFKQVTDSGTLFKRNKYLDELLKVKYGKTEGEIEEIWMDINRNSGSVSHLDFLEDYDKDVFKTAREIDQHWVVQHAADRQPFICQSQSVNLFFPAQVDGKLLDSVHKHAWRQGLKSLYYVRSSSYTKTEGTSIRPEENKLRDYSDEECLACAN